MPSRLLARLAISPLLTALVLGATLSVGAVMAPSMTSTAQAQNKGVKIAYVDLQRALNEVSDGKKAKARLKKMFNQRQKKLDDSQNALKKDKEDLEKKIEAGLLTPEAQRKAMMEYQKKFYELQMTYGKLQKELTEAEAKETKKIFGKMRDILKDVGLKEGYTVILEKTESSILWAPKSLDITDVLIQRYNGK